MPDVSYVPGVMTAVLGDGSLALVSAPPDSPVVAWLWQRLGQRARLPLLAVAAVATAVFLLTAGVVSDSGILSPAELHGILTVAVQGWQQLLTTGQPVGSAGGLLVLPYLLGLFSSVAGDAVARRTRTTLLPAAPPAVVVALSILFGAAQPAAAELQGAGFTVLAVVWAAWRQHHASGTRGFASGGFGVVVPPGGTASLGRQRP